MRQLVLNEPARVSAWVFERIPYSDDSTPLSAIGLQDERGELIAGVVFNSYTSFDIDISLAADPGRHWCHPRWIQAVFRYTFAQLACRRVTVNCASRNHKSLRIILQLGFRLEGCKREALPDDDLLVFGMTRRECRWLETVQ